MRVPFWTLDARAVACGRALLGLYMLYDVVARLSMPGGLDWCVNYVPTESC